MSEHKDVWEAFAAAQSEFKAPAQSGNNPHFKARYSTLGDIFAATMPALHKHGLAFTQLLGPIGNETILVTRITLPADEEKDIQSEIRVPPGANIQQFGSALSYMKRYSAASILGVVDGMETDGEDITQSAQPPPLRQRKSQPTNGTPPVQEEVQFVDEPEPPQEPPVPIDKDDAALIQRWLVEPASAPLEAQNWAIETKVYSDAPQAHMAMKSILEARFGGRLQPEILGVVLELYVHGVREAQKEAEAE